MTPSLRTPSLTRALRAVPALFWSGVALAQQPSQLLDPVIVVGERASLGTAQAHKRDKLEIVDSVIADDIQKLPDISVTDALQRVTGVQVGRDRGEGAAVTIRGLAQMETLLNGRELFTAGTGRNLDFADIPAEMVSAIHVYKTTSASQIEGGVGGTVDLRTRRPFDFPGRAAVASARVVYSDLARRSAPQASTLLSQRWTTDTTGEWGLLLNLSHQRRAWREDQKSAGNPTTRSDLVPGQSVTVPNGTSETTSVGHRDRTAGIAVLQWRPSPRVELHAEAGYAELLTRQDSHQISVIPRGELDAPASVPGSVALFPGTSDVRRVTWTDASMTLLSFARDTVDRTRQAAVGGRWSGDALTLRADASVTRSFNNLFFSGPFLAGTAARFEHDLSSRVPGTTVAGTDLLDPASFRFTGIAYRTRPFDGDLKTLQLDAELALRGGVVNAVSAGLRLARRGASNAPGLVFADAPVSVPAADKPGFTLPNPYELFPGEGAPSLHDFLIGNLDLARDAAELREAFGITAPIPGAGSALGVWDIRERTDAAYLLARFAAPAARLDGEVGVRLVRTRETVAGHQTHPGDGSIVPVGVDSAYTDVLPSTTLRWRLGPALLLRGALSRTVTRPGFDQLSPSLTLIRNPINPSLNQGGAGNPALEPVRSTNLDLALERYVGPSSSASATLFAKDVDGFVTTVSQPEVHGGELYQVSRPQNSGRATIKGVELAYQRFFDGLPLPWNGLGVQLNYTYVDSSATHTILGQRAPLQNLSRHSANLVGIYEKDRLSARVAWNWRDRFLSGVVNVVGIGALPVYTRAHGWLDASASYRFGERVTLTIEGSNLLRTMRHSYYGVQTRPQNQWLNDRQLGAMLAVRF